MIEDKHTLNQLTTEYYSWEIAYVLSTGTSFDDL